MKHFQHFNALNSNQKEEKENTQNHNAHKSQEFQQMNHAHSSVSHLLKKWTSNSLQWTTDSKLIQHCCVLDCRVDLHMVFTMTLIYRSIQIATITIHCIQLQQGIWELALGKWADINAPYRTCKMYKSPLLYFVMILADNWYQLVIRRLFKVQLIWVTFKRTH